MRKSTHSPENAEVLKTLVFMRKAAGLTQRELAKKLKREQSFVWRIETGERRRDVVELHWVCQALGIDSIRIIQIWFTFSGLPDASNHPVIFASSDP